MTDTTDDHETSRGRWHALAGVVLFTVGGLFLADLEQNPDDLDGVGFICFGSGLYLLAAGAVARGVQMARR